MSSSIAYDIESQQPLQPLQPNQNHHGLLYQLLKLLPICALLFIALNLINTNHQTFSIRNLLSVATTETHISEPFQTPIAGSVNKAPIIETSSTQSNSEIIDSIQNPFKSLGFDHSVVVYVWLTNCIIQTYYQQKKYGSYDDALQHLLPGFPAKNLEVDEPKTAEGALPQINPFLGDPDIPRFKGYYKHKTFDRYVGTSSQHISTVLYINEYTKHAIISFLGTKSKMDWYTDLKMTETTASDANDFHAEMYNVANNQIHQINEYLGGKTETDLWWNDFELITMSGCSLGGSLATIGAYFLHSREHIKVKKLEIVTCGQPMTLRHRRQSDYQPKWLNFKSAVDNGEITYVRIYHEDDPVPKLPGLDFFHIGKAVKLTEAEYPTGCRLFGCHNPKNTYIPMIYHHYFEGGADAIMKK